MRARTLLVVIAAALLVAFALMNWAEFTRPVPLNFGWTTASAPLGLILLGLLALATIAFMAASAANRTRALQQEHDQAQALKAQRELAERAEASRFVDLRQALDTHLRETRQREASAASELDQAVGRIQRDLRSLMEQMHRSLSTRLGEMEARLETGLGRGPVERVERVETVTPAAPARQGQPVAPETARAYNRDRV